MKQSCIAVLLCVLFSLFSCAAIDMDNAAHFLAVQYTTGKVIESGDAKARAKVVLDEVEKARSLLDSEAYPIAKVKHKILRRLIDKGLTPADMLLASTLMNAVELRIQEGIERGVIDAEQRVTTNRILDVIANTARWYL